MRYTRVNFILNPKHPTADILVALLSRSEYESFEETPGGLSAYIPTNYFDPDQIKELEIFKTGNSILNYSVEHFPEQNWNAQWESNFSPIEVEDKCLIRAPFHPQDNRFKKEIIISPQMSFGTGHHETTWLMCKAAFDLQLVNKTVLDMGCGTGILAILAMKLGASDVEAIDIDNWAYENTIENAKLNNVNFKMKLGDADLIKNSRYNVIFANINRNILLQDLSKYAVAANKGCDLLLSGFFNTDADTICQEAAINNFHLKSSNIKNQWTMLHFIKS